MPIFIPAVLKTYNAALSCLQHGAKMVFAAIGRRAIKRRGEIEASLRSGAMTMPPKPPNPIDVHVGRRIQMRRVEQRMSRATLGDFIGLTFQQVEKYERGVNRIGASRIQQICTALKIPVSFVFEGAPGSSPSVNGVPQYIVEFMTSAEGVRIVEAFSRITDPKVRSDLVRMVTNIANSASGASTVLKFEKPGDDDD
jgi:transcriptional regulator with XRE-family HTH domain